MKGAWWPGTPQEQPYPGWILWSVVFMNNKERRYDAMKKRRVAAKNEDGKRGDDREEREGGEERERSQFTVAC